MGVGKGGGAWYSQRGSLGYRRLTWGSTQGAGAPPARRPAPPPAWHLPGARMCPGAAGAVNYDRVDNCVLKNACFYVIAFFNWLV